MLNEANNTIENKPNDAKTNNNNNNEIDFCVYEETEKLTFNEKWVFENPL